MKGNTTNITINNKEKWEFLKDVGKFSTQERMHGSTNV